VDWILVEVYADNRDWYGHNMLTWRPRRPDGVLRWMLKDIEYSFDPTPPGPERDTLSLGSRSSPFLLQLLQNTEFRRTFINRFADYLNTRFSVEAVVSRLDEIADQLRPEAQRHIDRWRSVPNLAWTPYQNLGEWEAWLNSNRSFAQARTAAVRRHITEFFDLSGTAKIELATQASEGGFVRVNSLAFSASDLPWSGVYFRDVPVTVEAVADTGYRFRGWSGSSNSDARLELVLSQDTRLEPLFEPDPDFDPSTLRPPPHDLGRLDYRFTVWPAGAPAGTFPPHLLLVQTQVKDPGLAVAMEEEWRLPYDRKNRSRLIGLGELGLGFLNTSDPQPDPGAGFLGAAILALRTVGVSNLTVTWTGGTLEPNQRVYGLRLQYRIGNEGEFQDVLNALGEPVEYLRSPVVGDFQNIGPIRLPAETSDRQLVQLRWKYYFIPTGASGSRAALRLDDILVTGEGRQNSLRLISWQPVAGNRVQARFQGLPGELVRLWTSADLEEWILVRLLRATAQGQIDFEEPLVPGETQRYYRLERVL